MIRVRLQGVLTHLVELYQVPRTGELVVVHDAGVRRAYIVRQVEHRVGDELVVLHCTATT